MSGVPLPVLGKTWRHVTPYGETYSQWEQGPRRIMLARKDGRWYVIQAVYAADGALAHAGILGNRAGYQHERVARRLFANAVERAAR